MWDSHREGMPRRTSKHSSDLLVQAPQRRDGRGRQLMVSSAVLLTAAGLVAVTVVEVNEIMCHERHPRATSPPRWGSSATAPPGVLAPPIERAAGSSTCVAWPATKRTLDAASALPAGWYWDTSTSRADLGEVAAAVSRDLDLFDAQITAADPADVSAAAHTFIAVKRTELRALKTRTFDDTLAWAVTSARTDLNRVCGIPNRGTATA